MNAIVDSILLVAAFLIGALPLSVWVGNMALGVDIRAYGDGNPGAANVFRAGGRGFGLVAVFLDFLKGALPVVAVHILLARDFPFLAAVALAPVLGHASGPFLGWRGGKAVAVTFGVWAGLTAWLGPSVIGLCLLLTSKAFGPNGWAVLSAMTIWGICILLAPSWLFPSMEQGERGWLLATLIGNMLIVGWKHREDLTIPPRLFLGVF
jgi:acyl phosphate:glycerol-3-phosphate acyltransferase